MRGRGSAARVNHERCCHSHASDSAGGHRRAFSLLSRGALTPPKRRWGKRDGLLLLSRPAGADFRCCARITRNSKGASRLDLPIVDSPDHRRFVESGVHTSRMPSRDVWPVCPRPLAELAPCGVSELRRHISRSAARLKRKSRPRSTLAAVRHGQELCSRTNLKCAVCPVSVCCAYFRLQSKQA